MMHDIVKKTIDELNKILPKEKKIVNKDTSQLISTKSNLDSVDLVNLFVILEKNLNIEKKIDITFDDFIKNIGNLKTVGLLKSYLIKSFQDEEKK
jgi:acyl carrier protein